MARSRHSFSGAAFSRAAAGQKNLSKNSGTSECQRESVQGDGAERIGAELDTARHVVRPTSIATPVAFPSSRLLDMSSESLSPDERAQRGKDEAKRLREPVNLRTATVADLQRVPMVDRYLAEQIHAGVRAGTITRVDDLSKVKGIDEYRFGFIRPRVRWE